MDVLLCWSKKRSHLVAEALQAWLPQVLPSLKPWMSSLDIDKGRAWYHELHLFLSQAKAVIVCVTSENVRSPWIYYEAGFVASSRDTNLVCPFLLGEQPSILSDGPLTHVQCTVAEKDDVLRLLHSLSKQISGDTSSDSELVGKFDLKWGELYTKLNQLREMDVEQTDTVDFTVSEVDQFAGENLSSEARDVVLAAAQGRSSIMVEKPRGGYKLCINGKVMNEEGNPRSTAKWKAAIKTLVNCNLLEPQDVKGVAYELTEKGFKLNEQLLK